MNPFFPINTLPLMRGACGMLMDQPADFLRYVDSVFKAMWVDSRNMGEPEVIASFLVESGFDAAAFMAMVVDPRVKADLVMRTEASVERGVFGARTFLVQTKYFLAKIGFNLSKKLWQCRNQLSLNKLSVFFEVGKLCLTIKTYLTSTMVSQIFGPQC